METTITLSYPKYLQDRQSMRKHIKYVIKVEVDDALIEKHCSNIHDDDIWIREIGYNELLKIIQKYYPEDTIPAFEDVFLHDFEY